MAPPKLPAFVAAEVVKRNFFLKKIPKSYLHFIKLEGLGNFYPSCPGQVSVVMEFLFQLRELLGCKIGSPGSTPTAVAP